MKYLAVLNARVPQDPATHGGDEGQDATLTANGMISGSSAPRYGRT